MDSVKVNIGACPCPGTPHADGDTVGLRPRLGLKAGVMVQSLLVAANQAAGGDSRELLGTLSEAYLLEGVADWTLVDALGAPIPVTQEAIREHLLADFTLAYPVAEKADELYMTAVVTPLVKTASSSSQRSPTNGSTSASPRRSRTRQKQSKPSSTSTSQTGVTATTSVSLAGGSS